MVTVKFSGRFANCIFQYWAAAIFAIKHDFILNTDWPMDNWVKWNHKGYEKIKLSIGQLHTSTVDITDDNFEDWITRRAVDVPRADYRFSGYFQRMDLLLPYVQQLNQWFDWSALKVNGDDLCMHVRLTDHGGNGRLYIDPQWYTSILERENFKNLTILTDDPNATGHFDVYRKWNPKIQFSPNAMDDFNTLRSHRKIIIGPSSFAVLAAITGVSTKIYQWSRDQELPHIKYRIPWAEPVDGKFWRETHP